MAARAKTVEPRVVFDRVWKKFHRGEIHDSLRDLIPAAVGSILGRRRKSPAHRCWTAT